MPTKTDVRRLLKKGLTGKEAARLILQDSWEVDNEREGFLSESDIQAIKGSLRTAEDIQDYNKWVELYRLIDYSVIDAERAYLYISVMIEQTIPAVMSFHTAEQIRKVSFYLPRIVTNKEYEAIKAAQRQRHMEDTLSLWEIVIQLEGDVTVPEGVTEEWYNYDPAEEDDPGYEEFVEWLYYEKPAVFAATYVPYLITLIQENRLSPVMFSVAEREELERAADWSNRRRLMEQTYKRGKSRKSSPSKLMGQLKRLQSSRMSLEQGMQLLSHTYCLGEEVYEAGIASYREHVDTFKSYLETPTPNAYAILQEDEETDYDPAHLTWLLSELTDLDIFQAAFSSLDTEEPGSGLKGVLIGRYAEIMVRLKAFLAIYSVIEACSEITGIPFIEKLQDWYKIIKARVNQYNDALKKANLSGHYEYYEGPEVKLPPVDIERLKSNSGRLLEIEGLAPDPEHLQYMRERMAIALGPDWFRDTTLKLLRESFVLTAEEVREIRDEQERRGQYSPFKSVRDKMEAADE